MTVLEPAADRGVVGWVVFEGRSDWTPAERDAISQTADRRWHTR